MGAVAAVAAVGGAILSAYGAAKEGEASAEQARVNRQLAGMSATDALNKGSREAGLLRARGSQVLAQQHLGYANSGIDAQSGTPLDVMASTRMMSELDAQTAKNNAARAAWGYKVQGLQYGQQAALDEELGNERAYGSILGGLGQAASYYRPTPGKKPPAKKPPGGGK